MLQLCSIKLSKSPSPTPLLTEKFAAFGFNHRPASIRLKSRKGYYKGQFFLTNIKGIHGSDKWMSGNSNRESFLVSCLKMSETPVQSLNVAEKVHCLASEFKSLPEPIDRVKRLLHYATLLPPFDESARVQENRVTGCTTMVWLEAEMDNNRLMRFRVDSDSEITKGFSSCLIWLLDGAAPEEVLRVKNDDLLEMNVGFPSRVHSRVNPWNNILITMQKRTQNLVEERDREQSLKGFSPFVIRPDAINGNGSYKEAQEWVDGYWVPSNCIGQSLAVCSVNFAIFSFLEIARISTESSLLVLWKHQGNQSSSRPLAGTTTSCTSASDIAQSIFRLKKLQKVT